MNIEPIGIIRSCFKEKFGIPRQPGLVTAAKASLELAGKFNDADVVRGLEDFSHIWLIFHFHETADQGWKSLVRPPRLGGNERIGVFASRSMYRPNGMGLSVCKLDSISNENGQVTLHLSGADLLHNTPVLDIKPYLPYADCITDAQGAYANEKPGTDQQLVFSELARAQCDEKQQSIAVDLKHLITEILLQDPRPAFHRGKEQDREYGMKLYDMDIKWRYEKQVVKVVSLW